jgi:sortase (surface protein transpeptidase)
MKRIVTLALLGLLLAAPAAGAGDGKPPQGTPVMQIRFNAGGVHVNMKVNEGDPPGNEDGYFPTHYRSTNWPIWGQTVVISAHHYTHDSAMSPGVGGPFRFANQLKRHDKISLTMLPPFGTGTTVYSVTGQKPVPCGKDKINCPAVTKYWGDMSLNRLILTTCIDDGSTRRLIYAYEVPARAPPATRK